MRDTELDRIKCQEQAAFQRKQAAWSDYMDAKKRAEAAHEALETAWKERCDAREDMNREYEAMQSANSHYKEVWDEYGRTRDHNNSRIEQLRYEADREHSEMQRCFEQANSEYEYGDKSMAPVYAQEGRDHRDRRNELNAEISALCEEVKSAKQNAEWRATKADNSSFRRAQERFHQAKARHESAQAEFKRLKETRDRLKAVFDSAKAEHERLKAEFQRRLTEVKAAKDNRRHQMVSKVDSALVKTKPFSLGTIFGKNAKIVERNDGSGKVDVYFAGLAAAGDGLGHGHAVIDINGNVTYLRDAWSDHKDYLIDDRAPDGKTHKN